MKKQKNIIPAYLTNLKIDVSCSGLMKSNDFCYWLKGCFEFIYSKDFIKSLFQEALFFSTTNLVLCYNDFSWYSTFEAINEIC